MNNLFPRIMQAGGHTFLVTKNLVHTNKSAPNPDLCIGDSVAMLLSMLSNFPCISAFHAFLVDPQYLWFH